MCSTPHERERGITKKKKKKCLLAFVEYCNIFAKSLVNLQCQTGMLFECDNTLHNGITMFDRVTIVMNNQAISFKNVLFQNDMYMYVLKYLLNN